MQTKSGIDPYFTREGMAHTGAMYLGGRDPVRSCWRPRCWRI